MLLVGAIACCVLTACGQGVGTSSHASTGPVSISGADDPGSATGSYVTVPGRPLAAPAGSVLQTGGGAWRFRGAEQGKVTLLYFGYTSCPDVCPTTMADIAAALTKVPPAVRSKVDVQFVSTDPTRDTTQQMTQWLGAFDPTFEGGRAPIRSVIHAAAAYGIQIDPPKVTKRDYQVTHGAQVLVLVAGGDEVGYFRELAGPGAYARTLPELVRRYA